MANTIKDYLQDIEDYSSEINMDVLTTTEYVRLTRSLQDAQTIVKRLWEDQEAERAAESRTEPLKGLSQWFPAPIFPEFKD